MISFLKLILINNNIILLALIITHGFETRHICYRPNEYVHGEFQCLEIIFVKIPDVQT